MENDIIYKYIQPNSYLKVETNAFFIYIIYANNIWLIYIQCIRITISNKTNYLLYMHCGVFSRLNIQPYSSMLYVLKVLTSCSVSCVPVSISVGLQNVNVKLLKLNEVKINELLLFFL